MYQKNTASETVVVGLSALFIIGWVSVAGWFFANHVDFKRASGSVPDQTSQGKPVTSQNQQNQPTTAASPNQQNQPIPVESFAKVQNVPSGKFYYGGTPAWQVIRTDVEPTIQTVFPSWQLRYTPPSTGRPDSRTVINMLLDNELAFAQSSRAITTEEYQQASRRGFTLKEIPIAVDGIAIAVHPTLKIPGLTVAQLKDIYTGKIMNWNQVGGPDLLITIYSGGKRDGGTINFFVERILGGENFGPNVQFISSTKDALRQLASNTGGIYYASAPEIVRRCDVKAIPVGNQANELVSPYHEPFISLEQCPNLRNKVKAEAFRSGKYPIARQLSVIIKQNGKEEQRAGEAYSQLLLTNQGQELITKVGFINIR